MAKMLKKKIKVAVAMSGGVDSGAAAALLVRQGYKCAGFHMHLWSENIDFLTHDRGINRLYFENKNLRLSSENLVDSDRVFVNKCCSTESLEAARRTAHLLGIPFYVIDFTKIFKKRVVDYFLKEYGAGLTPNPCVMCNKFVKFGELLNYIRKLGFDYLATGHYARVVVETRTPSPLFRLLMALDQSKDQSYFLYNLTQDQLAHILFPVGNYTKDEVVRMAEKWKLPVAHRPESQEICFFPETDYRPFLERQIPQKIIPGEVVDTKGNVIGKHYGLPLYTIGQRHGFEIKLKIKNEKLKIILPYYVVGKDTKSNRLIVGFGKEVEKKEFRVEKVNWLVPDFKLKIKNCKLKIFVRIRHQGELLKSKIKLMVRTIEPKDVKVILDEGERGIAPGQAAVFYFEHKRETRSPSKTRGSYKKLEISIPKESRGAGNWKLEICPFEVLGGGIIKVKS